MEVKGGKCGAKEENVKTGKCTGPLGGDKSL